MKSHATYAGDPRHHHTDLAELRAEVERLRADRGELIQRLARADAELTAMANDPHSVETHRLRAKAAGVRLALSYMREMSR